MALRALGSLLSRRISPGRICRAQALGLASRNRPRSLHTMSDLDIGDGVFGVVAVGGFAALLYFKKDESALVPDRERNLPLHKDPAIRALFTDEHGNVNWMNYYDFFCFKKEYPNLTNEEIRDMVELTAPKDNNNVKTLEDVNESLMMSRFEQWIKQYGRTYKSKEEKARRYEAFKANAIRVDQLNALSQNCAAFVLKEYADWTEEERSNTCPHPHVDWETVFDMRARLSDMGGHEEVEGGEKLWTEAMKQLYLKQKAKAAEHTFGAKAMLSRIYGKARHWLQPRTPPQVDVEVEVLRNCGSVVVTTVEF